VFYALSNVSLLILDDLGSERLKRDDPTEMSWQEEQIDRLINERSAKKKPTIFTSNFPPSDLQYHDRLVSRIVRMSTVFQFPEIDIRAEVKVFKKKH